jgi:hypothetical protein
MTDAVMVALITGGLAILSNVIVALMNSKLLVYRIEQLEKKVEKHNNLVERVTVLERDDDTQWKRIDELKEQLNK